MSQAQGAMQDKMQYFSYLVRFWKTTGADGKAVWRASLERPGDPTRLGFPDMEALFAFLAAQCEPARDPVHTNSFDK